MKRKREPTDELIDVLVWIRAQRLQGRFRDGGALRGVPARRGSGKHRPALRSRGKRSPHHQFMGLRPKRAGRGLAATTDRWRSKTGIAKAVVGIE